MSEIVMSSVSMINGTAVGIFGILLSASFCDIVWTRKKRVLMAICTVLLLLIQGVIFFRVDDRAVRMFYPVITHVPLAVVLCVLSKRILWSSLAVLVSYQCCQLRRWVALLVVALCSGGDFLQGVVELLITVPLFWTLFCFAAPSIRALSKDTVSIQFQFGLVPILSYVFDYLTQVYTGVLSKNSPVVMEFMYFVCSAAYLAFVLRITAEKRLRSQLEQAHNHLNLQVVQAVREIEILRNSQQQAATYRHDLRHHMQYILACVENGREDRARQYIKGICSEIDSNKVTRFCKNETANLIFSAFAGRAEANRISMKIRADIPAVIPIAESDLCVLLSNGLENALHACQGQIKESLPAEIDVSAYEKNGRLFVQIMNSCNQDVRFEQGIPVSNRPGHGFGVYSICALAERYEGMYSFTMEDGQFIMRVSL